MKTMFVIAVALLCVTPAFAVQNLCYSWEDGGTTLCNYGANLVGVANVSGAQNGIYYTAAATYSPFTVPAACDGNSYLHVAEDPHTGTPSVVVAWIKGLQNGDVINGSICLYDPWDGSSTFPGSRIWGAYTSCADPCVYTAGASTNPGTYSVATGWYTMAWSWTYNGVTYPDGCFRIEVRFYSYPTTLDPAHTDFFVDNVCVEIPDHATVIFPEGQSPVETSTWTTIKALYR